jgi:hypothetical protein
LAAVPVLPAFFSEGVKGGDIQPMIALGIELNSVTICEQEGAAALPFYVKGAAALPFYVKGAGWPPLWSEGSRCVTVVDGLSQVVERLAQAPASFLVGLIGPQQAGQGLSVMRPVSLDTEVGKQGPRVVRGEVGDRLAVQGHLERSQHGYRKSRHWVTLRQIARIGR